MLQLHEAIQKRNAKKPMPILENSLIKSGYCYTTDLEFYLRSNSCDNFKDGLYRIIKKELYDTKESIDNFPETDFSINPDSIFNLDMSFFDALFDAANFCSKEQLRPAMQSVYFHNNKIVATNGHYLFVKQLQTDCTTDFLIPASSIELLKKAIKTAKLKNYIALCSILFDKDKPSYIIFDFEAFQVKIRLSQVKYPDYESVLPTSNPIRTFTANRKHLLNKIDALSSIIDKNESIKRIFFDLDINENDFVMKSINKDLDIEKKLVMQSGNVYPLLAPIDFNDLRLLMPVRYDEGGFCFDAKNMQVVFNSSDKETVIIHYWKGTKAFLINFE